MKKKMFIYCSVLFLIFIFVGCEGSGFSPFQGVGFGGDDVDDGDDITIVDVPPVEIVEDCFITTVGSSLSVFELHKDSLRYGEICSSYSTNGATFFTIKGVESLGFDNQLFSLENKSTDTTVNRHGIIFARDGFFGEGGDVEFVWAILDYTTSYHGRIFLGTRTGDGVYTSLSIDDSELLGWRECNSLKVERLNNHEFNIYFNENLPKLISLTRDFTGTGSGYVLEVSKGEIPALADAYKIEVEFSY